jgi:hypothetical protein
MLEASAARSNMRRPGSVKEQQQSGDAELDMISFYREPRVLLQMVGSAPRAETAVYGADGPGCQYARPHLA